MPIQRHKRQSDLEKRLQIIRRQVYGQNSDSKYVNKSIKQTALKTTNINQHASTFFSDLTFLYQDLLKILLLSSLAIGSQILLFFLLRNNVLRINFF